MKKLGSISKALWRGLLVMFPAVMYFSYFPVISLGGNETMNFELSLPLIWLMVFDVVGVLALVRRLGWGMFVGAVRAGRRKWWWLMFPVWATISVGWSLNAVRGLLTAGIVWLIVVAVLLVVKLRDVIDEGCRVWWWRVFFGAGVVACVWCVVQCVLDLAGVGRDYSLMCAGCVSGMFGFPHPNGFAIEPQFMGNLLLAPTLAAGYFGLKNKKYLVLFGIFASAIFLTFSRGAIYAMGVGLTVMMVIMFARARRKGLKMVAKKVAVMVGVMVAAFLFALNLQGIMAAVGPTNDSYFDGVAKVVNHLTLGVVEIRGNDGVSASVGGADVGGADDSSLEEVDDFDDGGADAKAEAVFDGYVAESTETRLRLTGAAVEVWRSSFPNVMVGVGLGGAGQALYDAGLSPAPKEIVQNEYASLLLETGVIGISLFVVLVVLVVRWVWRQGRGRVMVVALIVAYGVTLLFFSGLANAVHIYLLPVMLVVIGLSPEKVQQRA